MSQVSFADVTGRMPVPESGGIAQRWHCADCRGAVCEVTNGTQSKLGTEWAQHQAPLFSPSVPITSVGEQVGIPSASRESASVTFSSQLDNLKKGRCCV